MRTMTRSAALAALIALAGCASNPANKATVAVADEPLRGYDAEIDWAYVAKVNRTAQIRGVKVVWYHYPQKKPEHSESR